MFEEIMGERQFYGEPHAETTVVADELPSQKGGKQVKNEAVVDAILSSEGRATVWQALLGEKKETGQWAGLFFLLILD